jgi:hypothetical protein
MELKTQNIYFVCTQNMFMLYLLTECVKISIFLNIIFEHNTFLNIIKWQNKDSRFIALTLMLLKAHENVTDLKCTVIKKILAKQSKQLDEVKLTFGLYSINIKLKIVS